MAALSSLIVRLGLDAAEYFSGLTQAEARGEEVCERGRWNLACAE